MTSRPASTPIPATILTGFLGSGKTTLLNRILTEQHGEKIAVIENEFGEVGIDNALLVAGDEQIIEMNNGCICCTVRGDLVRILGELAERRAAGALDFSRVLIETTGLADPGPVAQTFFLDTNVAAHYVLDAVLVTVDAVHAMRQLDEHAQAQEQVGFADRLLLTKTDLVDAQAVAAVTARLQAINPRAPQRVVHFGDAPIADLLDIRGFNLDAVLDVAPNFLAGGHHHHHHHHDKISSFVFRAERPFDGDRLQDFLAALIRIYGPDLLRYKGVLAVKGVPAKVIVQGVHELLGSTSGARWAEGEARDSAFVFIGRDLPREIIEQGLRQSLAA